MNRALTTTTTDELYPIPEAPEVRKLIFGMATRDRDENGKMLMLRALTTPEREAISNRMHQLAGPLAPAADGKIKAAINQMFLGLGGSATGDDMEAAAMLAQYVATMRGLPLFAIKQACGRFARGEVTADEVGEERIIKGIRPSTAYLRIVAEKIARRYWDEASVGSLVLNGVVALPPPVKTEASREHVAKVIKETAAKLAEQDLEERKRDVADGIRREDEATRRHRETILADYEARGLEPVYWDPATKKMLVAVSTLLTMGWTIEDGPNDRPVLMRPRAVAS